MLKPLLISCWKLLFSASIFLLFSLSVIARAGKETYEAYRQYLDKHARYQYTNSTTELLINDMVPKDMDVW